MARIEGVKGFNNLLFQTSLRALSVDLEHRKARTPLNLSFKGYSTTDNVLNSKASQINGNNGDIKYKGFEVHSRPYYGYDARIDPTILNSVRNKFVDASGLLISNKDLRRKYDTDITQQPLKSFGLVL